jgi:hypothetical protein
LTLWFFFLCFFWGGGGGIGTVFSRGGTRVCFSLVEGGTVVSLFLWGDQYTIYYFFFSQLIFYFIPDLGGTLAPAGPPIDPSLHKTLPNQNKYICIIILKVIYLRFSAPPIKMEFELTCETER